MISKIVFRLFFQLFLFLIFVVTAFAQQNESFMKTLKLGDWIAFEGVPQPDNIILVQSVEFIAVSNSKEISEARGIIDRIDEAKDLFYIVNLPVRIKPAFSDRQTKNMVVNISSLKAGMPVHIRGNYTMDGIFEADRVEPMNTKNAYTDIIRWKGRVEGVELERKYINILGHEIKLDEQTRIKRIKNQ